MKLSVIIPTYNRSDSLEQTIDHLLQSENLPEEIIVVDQTTDECVLTNIRRICGVSSLITYVHNDEPSLTKARNTGIGLATGDVLVFMDDDVDVRPGTMGLLRRYFGDNPKLAMIAGLNQGEENLKRNSFAGHLFGRSSYRRRFTGHVTSAVYGRFPICLSGAVDTQWAMGFFFAVRANEVRRFKLLFDERLRYYAYAEDLDFTHRLYKMAVLSGLECKIYPEIIVNHNVSNEYRIPQRKAIFQVIVHRRYLSAKLFGSVRSKIACMWSDIGSVILSYARHENWKDYVDAIIFVAKNYKDIEKGELHYEQYM